MKAKNIIIGAAIGACAIGGANALEICAHTGTKVFTYQTNIDGTSVVYDTDARIWKVVFDAEQTLTGISACNEIAGTVGVATTNLVTYPLEDVGQYCWCKMGPVADYGFYTGLASYWVRYKEYTDAATCASSCTRDCANSFSNNTDGMRDAIFNSIW